MAIYNLGKTAKTIYDEDCTVTVRKLRSADGEEFVRVDVEIENAIPKVICDFTDKSIEDVQPHSINPRHVVLAVRKESGIRAPDSSLKSDSEIVLGKKEAH